MTASTAERQLDIVVPIYNAPDDVRRCVASVLACTSGDYRLIMIDDASPDPGVRDVFREIEQRGDRRIELLRNDRNLGFTATANRGMALSRADVVLLNSDTIVTRGWLEALVRCAASDRANRDGDAIFEQRGDLLVSALLRRQRVAGATRSGNRSRRASPMPRCRRTPTCRPAWASACSSVARRSTRSGRSTWRSARAMARKTTSACAPRAPAGATCWPTTHSSSTRAGARSPVARRSSANGTWNGCSRGTRITATWSQRYIAADPLRALREAAQSRLHVRSALPGVLHVVHHHGGGTETHVRALIAASPDRWRHYLAVAVGDRWQVEEHRNGGTVVTFSFERERGERWRDFLAGLAATFRIALSICTTFPPAARDCMQALEESSVPFGYTLHDLNFACPTITFLDPEGRYCGGVTDVRICQACVERAAGHVRRRRHRIVARAARGAGGARRIRHRAVAVGGLDAAPLFRARRRARHHPRNGAAPGEPRARIAARRPAAR